MTTVEAMALAIAVQDVCGLQFSGGERALCCDPRASIKVPRESCDCLQKARAALAAIEPTPEMLKVFRTNVLVLLLDLQEGKATDIDRRLAVIWHATLAAALKEGGG